MLRSLASVILLSAVLGVLPAAPVAAQSRVGPPERPVIVQVTVVNATQQPGPVDPGCGELKQQLSLMNFKSLRLVYRERFKLRMGQRGGLRLPEGRKLDFLPISIVDNLLHVQVQLGDALNTQMRLPSGRGVILGGIRHGSGVLLVHLLPFFRMPRPPSEALLHARERRRMRAVRAATLR